MSIVLLTANLSIRFKSVPIEKFRVSMENEFKFTQVWQRCNRSWEAFAHQIQIGKFRRSCKIIKFQLKMQLFHKWQVHLRNVTERHLKTTSYSNFTRRYFPKPWISVKSLAFNALVDASQVSAELCSVYRNNTTQCKQQPQNVFMSKWYLWSESQPNVQFIVSNASHRVNEVFWLRRLTYRLIATSHCVYPQTCIVSIIIFDYLLPHILLAQLIFNEKLSECQRLTMKVSKFPFLRIHSNAFVCECSS